MPHCRNKFDALNQLYDNCKDLPLDKCPITHLNHDIANRMWWAVRNHLGYLGTSNTHGLYVLRHTVASRLVSLKGFNAHKLMAFMGHTDIKSSLHYVHLNVDDIRDGMGVGVQLKGGKSPWYLVAEDGFEPPTFGL